MAVKYSSKRMKEANKLVDKSKVYDIKEAIGIIKAAPHTKFDECVQLSFKINIDPKQSSQSIRGTIVLPHGTGKKRKVLVFCKGEALRLAEQAGADLVGGPELIEKVQKGFLDFDVAVSTPDMMRDVGKLGKVLGPRGLMPSPKAGTVTDDVAKAVNDVKGGKIEFKMDKQANIHVAIGKVSFEENSICDNAVSLIEAVIHAKPSSAKSPFIKSAAIAATMGPGIKIDISAYNN